MTSQFCYTIWNYNILRRKSENIRVSSVYPIYSKRFTFNYFEQLGQNKFLYVTAEKRA